MLIKEAMASLEVGSVAHNNLKLALEALTIQKEKIEVSCPDEEKKYPEEEEKQPDGKASDYLDLDELDFQSEKGTVFTDFQSECVSEMQP